MCFQNIGLDLGKELAPGNVIALPDTIDLDNMNVAFFNNLCNSKDGFKKFITERKTSSYTIQQTCTPLSTHTSNVREIIREVQSGNFSEQNIALLRRMLSYDFSALTRKTIDSTPLIEDLGNQVYNPIAYLWDYNHKELDKELGL